MDPGGSGSENAEMEENNFSRSCIGNDNPIFRDFKLHATSAHDLSQDHSHGRSTHQHDFSPLMERSTYEKERTPSSHEKEDNRKSWDYSDKSFEVKDYAKPHDLYPSEYREY